METEPPENGMDELLRLSRGLTRKTEDAAKHEARGRRQAAEKRQVILGLRGITFAMALEQLKIVSAEDTVVARVSAYKDKEGTADLRNLITGLTSELEGVAGKMSRANPELASVERSIKTLSILIDLLFSLS
jgi:hypothetical protein